MGWGLIRDGLVFDSGWDLSSTQDGIGAGFGMSCTEGGLLVAIVVHFSITFMVILMGCMIAVLMAFGTVVQMVVLMVGQRA